MTNNLINTETIILQIRIFENYHNISSYGANNLAFVLRFMAQKVKKGLLIIILL